MCLFHTDTHRNLKGQTDLEKMKVAKSPKEDPPVCDRSTKSSTPVYQGGALGFKPFVSDSAKQERYDKYLAMVKQGDKG